MDWHDSSCRFADIVPLDESLWTCKACGSVGSITIEPSPAPIHAPHQASSSSRGAIRPLWWPASVEYLADSNDKHVSEALRIRHELFEGQEVVLYDDGPCTQNSLCLANKRESKPYIYPDLSKSSHIRLLELSPGDSSMALRGRLLVVDCDRSLQYYGALSYTWADAANDSSLCRRIYLGDDYRALPITLSCDRALRRLRGSDTPVRLWVDSICIDQASPTERSHQVSLMHAVYSNAATVHVYVGEEEHGDDKMGADVMTQLNLLDADDASWDLTVDLDAFNTFFSRPYFSRLWVVQEVLLARSITLHCGTLSLKLSGDTISKIRGAGVAVPPWMSLIGEIGLDHKMSSGHFVDLLSATRACGVTDLRDKIFGLLGLVQDAQMEMLSADYDLMVREVYIGAAAYLLQKQGRSDILELVNSETCADNRYRYGIPTWVPLWDASQTAMSAADAMEKRLEQFGDDCRAFVRKRGLQSATVHIIPGWPDDTGKETGSPALDQLVHASTGSLVTPGHEIMELGGSNTTLLLLPEDSSSSFWLLDGGAALAVHDPEGVLLGSQMRDRRLLRIKGCNTLFLANRVSSAAADTAYELVCPCAAAIIYKPTVGSLDTAPHEDSFVLQQCYPFTRADAEFLAIWRHFLWASDRFPTTGLDASKRPGRQAGGHFGSFACMSYEINMARDLWANRDTFMLYGGPRGTAGSLRLWIQDWDQKTFDAAAQLIDEINPRAVHDSFMRWDAAHRDLNAAAQYARRDWPFIRLPDHRLAWSPKVEKALETWRTESKFLAGIFGKLVLCKFTVTSHDERVDMTSELADELYEKVSKYPAECDDEDEILEKLRMTPVIGDADWSEFEKVVVSIANAAVQQRETQRMVEGRRRMQRVFQTDDTAEQIVIV